MSRSERTLRTRLRRRASWERDRFARRLRNRRLWRMARDRLRWRARVFERAYKTGVWTSTGEARSGDGSSLAFTESLRQALPATLRELDVDTLLDVPCGDWNWMSQVELPVTSYIGGDLVEAVVEENQRRYGNRQRSFRVIDICTDALPSADMLLCRDALVHFSLADIMQTLRNISRSEITYVAMTSFPTTLVNADQVTGLSWRPINLEAAPFHFPAPLCLIPEGPIAKTRSATVHERALGVWLVRDIAARVHVPPSARRESGAGVGTSSCSVRRRAARRRTQNTMSIRPV